MSEKPGPTEPEVIAAIAVIKAHLDAEWISEGCKESHAFGCASCQANLMKLQLDGIAGFLREDAPCPASV